MSHRLADTVLIKKPHQKASYSKEELLNFVRCADPVAGPLFFLSNFFWAQHPIKGKVLYKPYTYQLRMIDAYHNCKKSIVLAPRQCGKSLTAAGYLLWCAMFIPDQTILIAAHKFSGASEIMSRIRFGYENVPDYIRAGIVEYNKQSIVFDNGSRIIAQTTTETTGRGMSISIVYADELSYLRESIQHEFWASISMTLSTGGKIVVTSTPNNPDDLFASIWKNANKTEDEFGNSLPNGLGSNGFKAVLVNWQEHPDRDEAWAKEQKELLADDEKFAREVECRFIQDIETLINPFVLSTLNGIEPIRKEGQIRWYGTPQKNRTYLVALDPSLGTGGDYSAIQVFEAETKKQIAEWVHNKTRIEDQIKILQEITSYLNQVTENPHSVYWSVENNTIGEAALVAIRSIGEENIAGIFLSEPVKSGNRRIFRKGFNTTNSSKLAACAILKSLVENNKIQIFSKKLISEFRTFVSVENTYKAKVGESDDLVMSLILIIRMMESLKNYLPSLEDVQEQDVENLLPLPFIMSTSPTHYF